MNSFDTMMVAMEFNKRINQQDLEGLSELMSDDHILVVNSQDPAKGKESVTKGWQTFFRNNPDYQNIFTSVTVQDDVVIMIGYSTCAEPALDGPNVWTANITDGLVSEWRVTWLDLLTRANGE